MEHLTEIEHLTAVCLQAPLIASGVVTLFAALSAALTLPAVSRAGLASEGKPSPDPPAAGSAKAVAVPANILPADVPAGASIDVLSDMPAGSHAAQADHVPANLGTATADAADAGEPLSHREVQGSEPAASPAAASVVEARPGGRSSTAVDSATSERVPAAVATAATTAAHAPGEHGGGRADAALREGAVGDGARENGAASPQEHRSDRVNLVGRARRDPAVLLLLASVFILQIAGSGFTVGSLRTVAIWPTERASLNATARSTPVGPLPLRLHLPAAMQLRGTTHPPAVAMRARDPCQPIPCMRVD